MKFGVFCFWTVILIPLLALTLRREFVCKHLEGYVVATSTAGRKEYANFLSVWGKDRTYISKRHRKLLLRSETLNENQVSCCIPSLPNILTNYLYQLDAFEPELIKQAPHTK